MRVKPIEGATVYYPGTKTALPAAGDDVVVDTYWQRRLNDGSVVVVVEVKASKEADESAALNTSRRGR